MATKIIPKKSSVTSKVPLPTDLDIGEIAINLADQKLYSKNSLGEVVEINGGSVPSGLNNLVEDTTPQLGGDLDTNSFSINGDAANFSSVQLTGGTGSQGEISWNVDEETIDIILGGSTLQVGQELHYNVRNNTGVTIPNGTPVYGTGTLGNSSRITIAPYIADGSIPAKYFLGVTTEDITNDTEGKVTSFGKVRGIDTTLFNEGDILYPSATTSGAFTNTAPTGSNVALPIGITISSASNGTLFIRSTNHDDNEYATTAQGALADSSIQPGDNISTFNNDANYIATDVSGNITVAQTVMFDTLYDNGSQTSFTLNANNGQYQKVTLISNGTLTITEPSSPTTIYLHIFQATNGATLTLPSGKWSGGNTKTNTTTTNGHDILMIHYYGAGSYVFDMVLDLQ